MIRLTRIFGIGLMAFGAILLLTWLIEPLRFLWPWFRSLPVSIQVGLGAAGAGLSLLMGSVVWERLEDRQSDRKLLTDDDIERRLNP